jgi:hypothetical protein
VSSRGSRLSPGGDPAIPLKLVDVTPVFSFLVVAGLLPEQVIATTQTTTGADIVLELVKVMGIIVSAVAAMYCAKVANENRRTTLRVEDKVDRKRERVRKADHPDGAKVVIEEGDRKRKGDG